MFRPSARAAFAAALSSALALLVAALAPRPQFAAAEEPAAPQSKYLRFTHDADEEPAALETAVAHFTSNDADKELSVDLIAAVHVGDKEYYEQLNKLFKQYDVVLYELVAREGTRVPKGGGKSSGHPVMALQSGMKDMLELEHQLQQVDYQAENLLHADMSPEAFSQSMTDRGESVFSMMFRMMGHQLAQQGKPASRSSEVDLFAALFDKNRALTLKRLMAEQFEDLEEAMSVFGGPDGSTVITERNKIALKVLGEQIAKGKKHIAIFYGAGHMGDMEDRLVKEFPVHRDGEEWLIAWDLRTPAAREADAARKAAAEKEKAATPREN